MAVLTGISSDGSGAGERGGRVAEGEEVFQHHSPETLSDHDLLWVPPWLLMARSVVEEWRMRRSLTAPTKPPGGCKVMTNQLIRGFRGSLAVLRKPKATAQMHFQNEGAALMMEEKRYLDKKHRSQRCAVWVLREADLVVLCAIKASANGSCPSIWVLATLTSVADIAVEGCLEDALLALLFRLILLLFCFIWWLYLNCVCCSSLCFSFCSVLLFQLACLFLPLNTQTLYLWFSD